MPSRRMIDPSFWHSESIAELTDEQRLLVIGLISNADDQGRLKAHPALIRSAIYPYEDRPLDTIEANLQQIAEVGSIALYEADGRRYLQILNWWKYQHPQWAYPSKYPPMDGWRDRLRYRQDKQIVTENWTTPAGQCDDQADDSLEELPEDLPSTLPETLPENDTKGDRWPDSVSVRVRDSVSVSESGPPSGGADTPRASPAQPKKPKKPPKAPKAPIPPAVQVFHACTGRYPSKSLWPDIQAAVGGDLEFWAKIIKGWLGMGWSKVNVNGMLEFFRRREIPGGKRQAVGNQHRNLPPNAQVVHLTPTTTWEEPLPLREEER